MNKYEKFKEFVIDFIKDYGSIDRRSIQRYAEDFHLLPSSADRYARWYMERDKITTHPTENGKVNEHKYILVKKEVEEVAEEKEEVVTGFVYKNLTLF
jgi:hypothetical protein